MYFEKCIINCIFQKINIQYRQLDGTSIYQISNHLNVLTEEDIKKIPIVYSTIPNQELLDTFHINQADLQVLKNQLSGNLLRIS